MSIVAELMAGMSLSIGKRRRDDDAPTYDEEARQKRARTEAPLEVHARARAISSADATGSDAPALDPVYQRWRRDIERQWGIYEVRDDHHCWEARIALPGATPDESVVDALVTLDAAQRVYGCRGCGRTHRCAGTATHCPMRLADGASVAESVCLISGRVVASAGCALVPGTYEQERAARHAPQIENNYLGNIVTRRVVHQLGATASYYGDDRRRASSHRRRDNAYELHTAGADMVIDASARYRLERAQRKRERRAPSEDAVFFSGWQRDDEEDEEETPMVDANGTGNDGHGDYDSPEDVMARLGVSEAARHERPGERCPRAA